MSRPELSAAEHVPIRSVPEVIAALERFDVDLAVVPIENSIEGSVNVTLDTLGFGAEELMIQGEIVLGIQLHLAVQRGTQLSEIKTVVSHPHANAQCREWLAAKLPGVEIVAANSTAEAAQAMARSRTKTNRATITNALAAQLYGLEIIASDIEDHPENQTRFVILGRGVPARTGHDKTSIVVFQSADRPGSLLGILQEFAARAVNLTKLESRPTKRGLGHYCFFIDAEGHLGDELVADVLRNLAAKHTVRFLGSYPVATSPGAEARRKAAGKAWKSAGIWLDQLRAQVRPE